MFCIWTFYWLGKLWISEIAVDDSADDDVLQRFDYLRVKGEFSKIFSKFGKAFMKFTIFFHSYFLGWLFIYRVQLNCQHISLGAMNSKKI